VRGERPDPGRQADVEDERGPVSADGPYRDGRVHVLAEPCGSCIFRSVNDGRIAGLEPGRVAGMVQDARAADSAIVCHSTLYREDVRPAVCRGFFDLPRSTQPLQVAERLELVVFDPVPAERK
jgi:hypothetical protein